MEDDEEDGNKKIEKKFNGKVLQVYRTVGKILSKYKSGKLPKPFTILPSLSNWEEVIYLTNPNKWSLQATFQATKIFASNFNPKMAQRFYNLILLPKVRENIFENKKLNYHLYQALNKALFKPAAFFKGILIPLCEEANCTLKEATVIGSILAKKSIPVLHSAAALLKISQLPYSGANSLFIRILLNKKYSLPVKVIDTLIEHFLGFLNDQRKLPVLWHQSFLTFAQRYKVEVTSEQKEALKQLMKVHNHHLITPEIRRELLNSKNRGDLNAHQLPLSIN